MKLSTISRSVSLVARTIFCIAIVAFFFTANLLAQNQLPGSWKVYDQYTTSWATMLLGNPVVDNSGNIYVQQIPNHVIKFDGVNATQYVSSLPYVDGACYDFNYDRFHNCFWARKYNGMVRFDQNSSDFYSMTQFGSSSASPSSIAIDSSGNVWFTGSNSFVKFDGTNWQTVDYPFPGVNSVSFASNGYIWCTTYGSGAFVYNGTNWAQYSTENSSISSNLLCRVRCSPNGDVWFCGGSSFWQPNQMIKFDGTNWDTFNSSNGLLSGNGMIGDVEFTNNGANVWIVMNNRLGRYNGSSWDFYRPANSDIPYVSFYTDVYSNSSFDGCVVNNVKALPNNHLCVFFDKYG